MNELLNFMGTNIWILLLIISMMAIRQTRPYGILLIAFQAIFGTVSWLIIVITICAAINLGEVCSSIYTPKKSKANKLDEHIDPDYLE